MAGGPRHQAGDAVVAFAELPAAQPLKVVLADGARADIEPRSARPRSRCWAALVGARIKRLEQMSTQEILICGALSSSRS
ncbi:MAG: hypothetical protein R3F43_14200 [bacterium]